MDSAPYPFAEKRLIEMLDLPLSKSAFSIPTEALLEKLSELFHIEKPTLTSSDAKVIPEEELENLFSENVFFERLIMPPLEGELYFIISPGALKDIAHLALHKESKEDEIASRDFLEGMKRFLTAEALVALNAVKFDLASSALIEQKKAPSNAGCLYPITLTFPSHKVPFHLFATTDFLKSYKTHTKPQKESFLPEDLKKSLITEVSLEAGQFSIALSEFASLKEGDFITLDRCSIDPDTGHGSISFCLKQKPIFRGKVKEDQIKILEYPFDTIGELNGMSDEPKMPKSEGPAPSQNPLNPPLSEPKMPDSQTPLNDEQALSSSEERFDTPEVEGQEAWIEPGLPPLGEAAEGEMGTPDAPQTFSEPLVKKADSTLKSAGDISLDVHVELGRLEMSAERLLSLAPGQVLEMGIHVEEGVSCMVGDTKVASGELVKLGDLIGVRLTKVAKSN